MRQAIYSNIVLISCISCLLLSQLLIAHTTVPLVPAKVAFEYIEKYKNWAVQEMHHSQVPASITLAQGMFESDFGRSELATNANNHFGIKCHSSWQGKKAYYDDDAPNECFRHYNSVYESYVDHSELLKKKRYSALFLLEKTDYAGWAKGLKKAGYATDPKYATKLIRIIEDYELFQYDYILTPAKPIIYADRLCLEYDKELVASLEKPNMTEVDVFGDAPSSDLSSVIKITSEHKDTYNTSTSSTPHVEQADLETIDAMLAAAIKKRPKRVDRKCLMGAPSVMVDATKIEHDINKLPPKPNKNTRSSTQTTKPTYQGTGKELNKAFNTPPKNKIAGAELNPAFTKKNPPNTSTNYRGQNYTTTTPSKPAARHIPSHTASKPADTKVNFVFSGGEKPDGNTREQPKPVISNTTTPTNTPYSPPPNVTNTPSTNSRGVSQAVPAASSSASLASTSANTSLSNKKVETKNDSNLPEKKSDDTVVNSATQKNKPQLNTSAKPAQAPPPAIEKMSTFNNNGVPSISYNQTVSPQQIARIYDLSLRQVLNYNDVDAGATFPAYTFIYLAPKKKKAAIGQKTHKVLVGETMWDIAQHYGITLEDLYIRNKMKFGQQARTGETILLRSAAPYPPKIDRNYKGSDKHFSKFKGFWWDYFQRSLPDGLVYASL